MEVWRCGGGFLLSNNVTRKLLSNCSRCCETWGVKCDTWCITKLTRAVPKDEFLLWLQWFINALMFTLDQQISCKLTYRAAQAGCLQVGASFCWIQKNKKQNKNYLTKERTINLPKTPHRLMSSSCWRCSTFRRFTPKVNKKPKKTKQTKADTSDHVSGRNAQAVCEWDDA